MKKVWLMGKVRDLDMNDLKPFVNGVNDDLANLNGKDLKGAFSAISLSQDRVSFYWGVSIKDEPDSPDEIPLIMWWLITGECDKFQPAWDLPTKMLLNACPNAHITYLAEDLSDLYKKYSKYYGADKFKKVNIQFNPDIGLKMTIKF